MTSEAEWRDDLVIEFEITSLGSPARTNCRTDDADPGDPLEWDIVNVWYVGDMGQQLLDMEALKLYMQEAYHEDVTIDQLHNEIAEVVDGYISSNMEEFEDNHEDERDEAELDEFDYEDFHHPEY